MEEEKLVHLKTRSSQLGMLCDLGSEGVPCNCLGYGQERRYGIPDRCSNSSGAYYSSSCGNGDRQPSSIYENPGLVHHPGLQQDQGSPRVMGHLRYGRWQEAWSSLS